jgi:hypothetical protein
LRRVIVYIPVAVSRVVVMTPVVAFIAMMPAPPPPPVICKIEYERPLINAAEVDVPAAAEEANKRTIAGDVGAPLTTVCVYGVCPIM